MYYNTLVEFLPTPWPCISSTSPLDLLWISFCISSYMIRSSRTTLLPIEMSKITFIAQQPQKGTLFISFMRILVLLGWIA